MSSAYAGLIHCTQINLAGKVMNDCLCPSAVACGDIWKHVHAAGAACWDKGHFIIYITANASKGNLHQQVISSLPLCVHRTFFKKVNSNDTIQNGQKDAQK